ncbi:hypothetical protein FRC09_011282 [Ceratobasidium sp. 395]|nr:hypothetical protein FRC09_011282 [Ceratobasidium sp. 395]
MDLSSLWRDVTRTWAAFSRETDEIEHVDAAIFALEERLSQLRGLVESSPRTHLDAVRRQISKDENKILEYIDDIEARLVLVQEQVMFRRLQAQRIARLEADTPHSDPRARDARDRAETIWMREEAQIRQRINRMSAMRLEYHHLATSARINATVDAEPPVEELQRTPSPTDILSYTSSTTPIAAGQFVRERRPSNVIPSSVPASGDPTTTAKGSTYVLEEVEGSGFEGNKARAPLKPTASHHLINC